MELLIFAIYDSKAEAHLTPFFFPTIGLALRSFTAAASEEGHDFKKFAADYTLFQLGTFNQSTGRIESLDAPVNLGNALTLISHE